MLGAAQRVQQVFGPAHEALHQHRHAAARFVEPRARHLTRLDGADGKNPVRAVKAPRVRYDDPRGMDYAIIERILAQLPDRGRPQDGRQVKTTRGDRERPTVSLTKLRLRVMAYTACTRSKWAGSGRVTWISPGTVSGYTRVARAPAPTAPGIA